MNNKIDWFAIPAPRDSDLAIDDRDIWIGASPALFRRVAEIMRKQIDPQRADLTAAVDAVVKSIASELRFINSRIDKLRVELNSRIGFAEERFIDGCREIGRAHV